MSTGIRTEGRSSETDKPPIADCVMKQIDSHSELTALFSKLNFCDDCAFAKNIEPEISLGLDCPERASFVVSDPISCSTVAGAWKEHLHYRFTLFKVTGWIGFVQALNSYSFDHFRICDPQESHSNRLSFGFDDLNGTVQLGAFVEFDQLLVEKLEVTRSQNLPNLSGTARMHVKGLKYPNAKQVLSWFEATGHDIGWRIMYEQERAAEEIEDHYGFFLQFRDLISTTDTGMMPGFTEDGDDLVISMPVNPGKLKRHMFAVADVAKLLDAYKVECGNCTLSGAQFHDAVEQGYEYLYKHYNAWPQSKAHRKPQVDN